MFDTMQVAKRIRNARIQRNMTQTELADAMGVSYQAVSNWERGNSMPDIAKLPELCRLLDISFEQLVDGASPEIEAVKKYRNGEQLPLEEAARIAPLLPPKALAAAAETAQKKDAPIDLPTLLSIAPFLDSEYLDALAQKSIISDVSVVVGLAPFLSQETLDALVCNEENELIIDAGSLTALAPFLSRETLDRIVSELLRDDSVSNLSAFSNLFPFLSAETIRKIADRLFDEKDYEAVSHIAPFL